VRDHPVMDRGAGVRAVTSGCVLLAVLASAVTVALAFGVGPTPLTVLYAVTVSGFVAVPVLGAAVVRARAGNPVGWILLASGVSTPVAVGGYVYARVAVPAGWPGAVLAGWLDGWLWVPAIVLVPTVGLLLFPDGHLPSARWRPLLVLHLVVAVLLTAGLLFAALCWISRRSRTRRRCPAGWPTR
jgi:hypothetical protein